MLNLEQILMLSFIAPNDSTRPKEPTKISPRQTDLGISGKSCLKFSYHKGITCFFYIRNWFIRN